MRILDNLERIVAALIAFRNLKLFLSPPGTYSGHRVWRRWRQPPKTEPTQKPTYQSNVYLLQLQELHSCTFLGAHVARELFMFP
jgi:hypothetical protein